MQMSNPKCNQQLGRNKKKGKNNCKGGNKNENGNNNDKNTNNVGGDKHPKRKVKFPCKLCKDDHLTHLCPHMEDASKFIAQGPTVFTNPLPNNQNMNSRTVDLGITSCGPRNPLDAASGHGCINMVNPTNVVMCGKEYGSSQCDLGKEPDAPERSLQIEKPMDKPEVLPHIPKGVLKCSRHNPNAQAT